MNNQYLFIFTISPVQSFIEQARKTHDLYAGSQILSSLISYAMQVTGIESLKFEPIFPVIDAPSKPNRFLAIVDLHDSQNIQDFGDCIKSAVKEYFINEFGKEVLELQPDSKDQLDDFLKIYWVAQEFDSTPNKYSVQVQQLEQNLGATKNIRYFNQISEKGRKCSLNGEYNVKFYRLADKEITNDRLFEKKLFHRDVRVLGYKKDYQLVPLSALRPGEGLCAISMLKRFYRTDEANEFESTANIALLDTLYKLDKIEKGRNLLNSFVCCFNGMTDWKAFRNGQLFYEENLTEHYFQKQGINTLGLECAREKLNELQILAKNNKLKISKYYAILLFDADGMGRKLQKCESKEQHHKISKLLASFANKASNYIDNGKLGRTVYAGGDDFLGFINLNQLFLVMKELRKLFDDEVNEKLKGVTEEGKEFDYSHLKLTFSAGVAIAHYKTPLSEVLAWARKMEKQAKKIESATNNAIKKDAFAIAVLKHSGEIHHTTWRWKNNEDNWTINTLCNLIYHLQNKNVSNKFITNLSSEYTKVLDESGDWGKDAISKTELNEILGGQLEYFMLRAKTDDFDKTTLKKLGQELFNLYEYNQKFDLNVQNFLNMLHICDFISRNLNSATKCIADNSQKQLA